jgi:hypothetical protein
MTDLPDADLNKDSKSIKSILTIELHQAYVFPYNLRISPFWQYNLTKYYIHYSTI